MELLRKSSHRWRRLDISHSTSRIKTNITELDITGGLPSLEELHLKLRCTKNTDNMEVLEFTADCPKLTRLFLQAELGHPDEFDDEDDDEEDDSDDEDEDEGLWTLAQDHHIPWHQLTTLVWGLNSSEKEVLDVLSETERLETLEILPRSITVSEGLDPAMYSYTIDPVILQHLTSLRYEEGYRIIHGLCCPVLERLHMSDIDGEALSGFLVRSDPPLKTLRMDNFHRDWLSIKSELMPGVLPFLEEFIIGDSVYQLLEMINDESMFEIVVPPTRVFTIDTPTAIESIWDDETWAIGRLVRLIWPQEGLEAFNIFTRERDYGESILLKLVDRSKEVVNKWPLLRHMNVLRDEGLKVTVSYSPSIYPDSVSSRDYY
ncbi:hypothetical protein CYLTODRAFT_425678 [Cylindrobasidium torrendii FP15055 ss-10]|uniref:F-box domain-containing protein n=1 Tax=Cylindrobasidium torrendii FP15055 ss-10 TaxID=1314674 RepID=A0A0D7AZY3_9AGAR|nr:hypothetical protein CYLTODRAFT_425678 [Cylindrobasidium torrendii FP15055 ss-10]